MIDVPDDKATDYGNSHASKKTKSKTEPAETIEKKPKIEPIANIKVKEAKVPLGRKVAAMFKGDDASGVGNYLLGEVFVPAIKDLVTSMVREGIERMMYGDSRPASRGHRPSYTSYNSVSRPRRDEPRAVQPSPRATHDFRDIVVEDRGSAELVLERISDLVEEYGVATLADLYELVGITPSFVDNKYGWNDIRGFNTRRVRDGYLIVTPRPVVIE